MADDAAPAFDAAADAAGTPDTGSGQRIAAQFAEHYPWLDVTVLEAYQSILDGHVGHRAALARYFDFLGVPKTQARFSVVRALYFAPHHRLAQHEIRNDMRVTAPNVSKLIDGLEKDGLVARTPHAYDRRVTYVQLTPQGEELANDLLPAVAKFMEHLFRGFSPAEMRQLTALLERFRHNAATSYRD